MKRMIINGHLHIHLMKKKNTHTDIIETKWNNWKVRKIAETAAAQSKDIVIKLIEDNLSLNENEIK